MRFLVSYDVSDDKRRTRLSKALRDFGNRVQYSVFECEVGKNDLECLKERAKGIVDPLADSVRIYAICAACENLIEIIGTGEVLEDPDIYIV